jgi:hypothetical protein
MRRLSPELLAALFQPIVQSIQGRKVRHRLPQAVTGILNVLLDLPLLPAGSRIAELGIEEIMAGHGQETGVDLAVFATSDLVDGGPHVVIDPAPWHAAEHAEGMIMSVEQHLVRLLDIGADDEGSAIR